MNKLFQFIWHYIAKKFITRKSGGETLITLDEYSKQMLSQIKVASLFGDIDLVILGDSNGEELADYESMQLFPKLSVNLSIGGTRADHWEDFFRLSGNGIEIRKKIESKKIVINIGGNNVLQRQLHKLPTALSMLNAFFPNAYWINIPYVYSGIIASLQSRNQTEVLSELKDANRLIADIAGNRLIDIKRFTGENDLPYFGVLKDAVHFTDFFDKIIRIPLIIDKVYR